jgi:hypothetical protein
METKKAPGRRGKSISKASIPKPGTSLHDVVGDAHLKACEAAWALVVDALVYQSSQSLEIIKNEAPCMQEKSLDDAVQAIKDGARVVMDMPEDVRANIVNDVVAARQIRDHEPYREAIRKYSIERRRYDLAAEFGHALRTRDAGARGAALADLLTLEHESMGIDLLSIKASEMLAHPPEPDRILIHDLLIRGGVLCLAGQSKAGKSCALMQMALAMAAGGKLFGRFDCEPATVVMVDLESTPAILHKKMKAALDFGQFKGWLPRDPAFLERLRILTLPDILDATTGTITAFARRDHHRNGAADALIIDPIYLVDSQSLSRDENAAGDMTRLLTGLRAAAYELGASLIYSHHFSKGAQGGRDFWDRASGSGVHARFAFCLAALSPLEANTLDADSPGVLFEALTRGWKAPDPLPMRFTWPCFEMDASLPTRVKGSPGRPPTLGAGPDELTAIVQAKGDYSGDGLVALHVKDLADALQVSEKTARRRCSDAGLDIKHGFVLAPETKPPVNIEDNEDEIPFD